MKKRRDITLGEMQDECKRVFGGCALCRLKIECSFNTPIQPRSIDLTDPPRFNEAQMEFWRGLFAIGVNFVKRSDDGTILRMAAAENAECCTAIMVMFDVKSGLGKGEELNLAELLGKDGDK